MEKHHSCLNTRAIIEYFQENLPWELPRLFDGLGPEIDSLPDPLEFLMEINNWVSSDVVIQMFKNARKISQVDDIAFKIGFESAARKKLGYVQRIIMFAYKNPRRTLRKIQKINDKFNKSKTIEILDITRECATVRLHWFKNVPNSLDFCLFNKGIYAGIPTIWNLPPALVEEPKCFFRGDDYCEYRFQWQEKSFLKETILRLLVPWRLLTSTIEELERDKELLKKKFEEVHFLNIELKQKIDQLMCLQETSAATLSILNLKELLQVTLRLLVNFAKLDRAGILLLDERHKVLELRYAVGIDTPLFEKIRDYKIPISKLDNIIARVAMTGMPVVVQDVDSSKLNRDNPLLQLFQPKAFILAPLTVRGKVIGVILADRIHREATFTDSDKEFVVSFANQIAIALENAILYGKLEVSERKYRELVENANEGIWIVDEKGAIKFVNRRLSEITGDEDLVNKNIRSLFDLKNLKLLKNVLAQNQKGNVAQQELEITAKNRGLVSVLMSSVPLIESGHFQGAFAMFSDITEMKQMERQLLQKQKMEAIGTMAGGIAHNINNILMNIMGLTGILISDLASVDSPYQELKQIEQEVSKGAALTKQLLSFGRGAPSEPKPLDLNGLADSVATLFCSTRREITLTKNLAPELPPVEADKGQIEQVLMNLFVNAWQAIDGKGSLEVATREVFLPQGFCELHGRPPGRYVQLSLTDSGIGMDEQTKARIFEPFFTTKEVGQGTGLGLATVYAIIKNHKGIIEVSSKQGQGTTFHLYLPISSRIATEEKVEGYRFIRGNGTVLLVDDEEITRSVGAKILERLGYTLLLAESGPLALSLYESQKDKIDLVILDMIMPGMGGRETYKRLKQIDPEVKVMLSSGYSLDGEAQSVIEEGALGFIQKPYQIDVLSQKVAEVLNGG